MIYAWTSQFENLPTGSDFGSVVSSNLREHKKAFEERFSLEHYLDIVNDPAVGYHLPGRCSIVMIDEDTDSKAPTLVNGSLRERLGNLYTEFTATAYVVSTISHLSLIDVDAADHPAYLNKADPLGYSALTGALDLNGHMVVGMRQVLGSAADDEIISIGSHMGPMPTTGECKHESNCITLLNIPTDRPIRVNKFKHSVGQVAVVGPGLKNVTMSDYGLMPAIISPQNLLSATALYASTENVNDYAGRFRLDLPADTYTFEWIYLETT